MIRAGVIWGLARAEARLTRRLARYWLFVVLATLVAAAVYLQYYFLHRFISWLNASAASINPRYLIAGVGSQYLLLFLVGLIFLGFEVRARDRRERIVEVLDTLPCTNVELVAGKFLGILIAAWIPVVVVALLLELVGLAIGAPLEPRSLVSFVFLMALPAYVFTLALVFFLTLVLRHRLLAALGALAVIVVGFFGTLWWVPIYASPVMDVTGGYGLPWPSDITGKFFELPGLLQRVAFFIAGLGLLMLAAAIHPRKDDGSRPLRAAIGLGAVLVGVGIVGTLVLRTRGLITTQHEWRAAHVARSTEPVPDLLALSGDVDIAPGRALSLDLQLRFRAPADSALERALFTLNPGLAVSGATGPDGRALPFTQRDGLLELTLPSALAPGAETTVQLAAQGVPQGEFAYFDAAIEPLELTPTAAQLFLLGYDSVVYDRRFVALLPGVAWLPSSGTMTGRHDVPARPPDFHTVDLRVDVPDGWLVAGPGRREPVESAPAGHSRFRFASGSPIPGAALIAGRFVSRTTEESGVQLEVLLHPSHTQNLEFFDDAAGEIRSWLGERFTEASKLDLGYPYGALTLVEIPTSLRGFGGGWRMDTTLAQPAMILLRETSFPTARFASGFGDGAAAREREGGIPRAKRQALERFFEGDMNGGNPFVAGARSFFGFATAGRGPEGVPLDYVCETLTTRLLTDKHGYFSVHLFDAQIGQAFQGAQVAMQSADRVSDSYARVMINMLTSTPEVWDSILEVSLADLDPWKNPKRSINVLSLKGSAMAQSLLDQLGRERAGRLLGALRARGNGGSYSREDFLAAARDVGADLDDWLDVWLNQTRLPGFVVGDMQYYRITDAPDGTPRYQARVTVLNEEPPAGMMRVGYSSGQQDDVDQGTSDPVLVPGRGAVEVGWVTSKPLRTVQVVPYLALNRQFFWVVLPALDEEKIVAAEPFIGSREATYTPPADATIVVDDLDAGFTVTETASRGLLRFAGSENRDALDQGLPIPTGSWRAPARWSRRTAPHAYGRYRHTLAEVRAGKGERQAEFKAEIPHAGQWELSYYVPKPPVQRENDRGGLTGSWKMTVIEPSGRKDVVLDAESAQGGWNSLGKFDLPAGEVRVALTDESKGRVIADAIRWQPVATERAAAGGSR